MTSPEQAELLLSRFVERFEAAWNNGDFMRVRELWSDRVEEPWHFPEETEQPVIGWQALDEYLQAATQIINEFSVKTFDAALKPVDEGSLYLFRFNMIWRATMSPGARPIGAKVKVSGLLKVEEDELKLLHYMEAGPAALPFIRSAYERAATESLSLK